MLLGFVLGPRFEDNFRRALDIAHGDLRTFIDRPISAFFLLVCLAMLSFQIFARVRGTTAETSHASAAAE